MGGRKATVIDNTLLLQDVTACEGRLRALFGKKVRGK